MVETENWKEISKAKATNIFNNYGFVYGLASKLNPENPWLGPVLISTECYNSIEGFVGAYKYYNCNKETGMGIRYYIRKDNK